ncbi:ribosome recycling factor, partial [Hesseltinella vesiculosa]
MFKLLVGRQPIFSVQGQHLATARHYAKKTGKKKGTGGDQSAKEESLPLFNEQALEDRFTNVTKAFQDQLGSIQIGRANPALLDSIRIPIDGVTFSLHDLAQVAIRDPQTLLVTVHDPEFQKIVDKSIRDAGLNLNPINENKNIRIPILKPTKESREKLVKLATTTAEQMRSRIRLVRQDGMKQLKSDAKTQSKDEIKKLEKSVQALTDKHNKEIDALLNKKLNDLI